MDMKLILTLGLYICCVTISNCQRIQIGSGLGEETQGSSLPTSSVSSGSGDLDTQGGDDEDIIITPAGSGQGEITTTKKTTTVAVSTNPDDEGGDDNDIDIIPSGSGQAGSGDDRNVVPEGTMTAMSEYMDCSDKFLYCWCKNERGLEIPGTRRYQGDPTFLQVDCEQQVQLYLDTTTVAANNIDITEVTETEPPFIAVEESTTTNPTTKRPTTQRMKTTTEYQPPYEVDQVSTKFGKPADVTEPQEGVGSDGVFKGDDGVDKEPIDVRPLFSHPGILAAVIGGGVVALLCALLLIMFVVYRMRKKDEGSYPLDPDAKPPRLHTYTRAPNKEFYA